MGADGEYLDRWSVDRHRRHASRLRRSHDKRRGKAALHLVSAWGSANGVVLGQVATDAKSNEITAIPELLRLLDLKGCTPAHTAGAGRHD